MNSRTLTAGVVACALGAVAVGVGLGDRRLTVSTAAAAMPYPMPAATSMPAPAVGEDRIQIALLVDTSRRMAGFDEACTRLWKVVGEAARATRQGRRVRLEIALYELGSGTPLQVLPFTDDLDRVADALFALTPNVGEDYGGVAVERAIEELGWSASPHDLRLAFIVGGGPADEVAAIAAGRARGVRVTAIHLGDEAPVAAPQDDELARLRAEADAEGCLPDAAELARLPFDQLPPDARLLTATGLAAYVDDKRAESERLAERIEELSAEREAAVRPWRDASADDELLDPVHVQGALAGYRFE
jgi:hypothetical protein